MHVKGYGTRAILTLQVAAVLLIGSNANDVKVLHLHSACTRCTQEVEARQSTD